MKNSNAIFDIQARSGVVARASMRRNDPSNVTVQATEFGREVPVQCAIMNMATFCLKMLHETAQQDPSIVGRYSFIVPETVAIRFWQAQKCVNNKQDVASKLFLPWMNSKDFEVEVQDGTVTRKVNIWQLTIAGIAEYLTIMMDKSSGWSLNFVNHRTLYDYELKSNDNKVALEDIIDQGDIVKLNRSVSEDGLIVCTENNFVTGEFPVKRRNVRNRSGVITSRFYIPRVIPMSNLETGETKQMTVVDAIKPENSDWDATYQNGVYVINAAILRTKTAELLPRVNRTATVTKVAENSQQF